MKEAVKVHMVCVASNNDRHPVPKTFTTLHSTCQHFTSSNLNFTHLHFTTLSFGLTPFKFGPGNSVGIATDYGLDGPGSNDGRDKISTRPDRSWVPPSLL